MVRASQNADRVQALIRSAPIAPREVPRGPASKAWKDELSARSARLRSVGAAAVALVNYGVLR
eukprot:9730409-Lingulodinium_polyedra.AAC.1